MARSSGENVGARVGAGACFARADDASCHS